MVVVAHKRADDLNMIISLERYLSFEYKGLKIQRNEVSVDETRVDVLDSRFIVVFEFSNGE
jgi:hypothetical protein